MQPASTVMVSALGSIARMRFMRRKDKTMDCPESSGVAPPTSPVLPPWGTMAMR